MFVQPQMRQSTEQGSSIPRFFLHRTFACVFFSNRTSTVILVRRDQTGLFLEKTLSNPLENPSEWAINTWQFRLNDINEPPALINEQKLST